MVEQERVSFSTWTIKKREKKKTEEGKKEEQDIVIIVVRECRWISVFGSSLGGALLRRSHGPSLLELHIF